MILSMLIIDSAMFSGATPILRVRLGHGEMKYRDKYKRHLSALAFSDWAELFCRGHQTLPYNASKGLWPFNLVIEDVRGSQKAPNDFSSLAKQTRDSRGSVNIGKASMGGSERR